MKQLSILVFAILSLCFNAAVLALSTDREQPADIEADDIEFDFKKGIRTYNKNVIIVQGTLRIKADRLVTLYSDGELTEATATGSLARFKQRPDGKPDDVEGWAEKIVVDQTKNILTLYGKAGLQQGADTARGETIIYDMANDVLKVQGGAELKSSGADGQASTGRKLEDPFKDDPIPDAVPTSVTNQSNASNGNSTAPTTSSTPANTPAVTPAVTPAPSGRSRLIIQPKE